MATVLVECAVDYSKPHGDNKDKQGDEIAESHPKLVEQLLNSFSRIAITVDVRDPLILDQSTTNDLDLFDKTGNQWKSGMILKWILREINSYSCTKILAICDLYHIQMA